MPTTLLDGETWDQAKTRRFIEEAEFDALRAQDPQCPACGSFETNRYHHTETFAVPECHYWQCHDCDHQWGHE